MSKEILGQVRSKFGSIPIPNDSVTLNGPDLISQAREEQQNLKEELKELLDQLTYQALSEGDAAIVENSAKLLQNVPNAIYVG